MKPAVDPSLRKREQPPTATFDAVVLGAGPAGATAARLLASWGYDVAIVQRPARLGSAGSSLAESLPPSTRRLFAGLEMLDAIEAAGFYRSTGNTSWWSDDHPRVERFAGRPEDAGYQVVRATFDRVLLEGAGRAGAKLHRCTARRVAVAADDTAYIKCDPSDGTQMMLKGRFVIDCSGRAGVVARAGLRTSENRYRTVAIAGVWRRRGGWGLPGAAGDESATHTLVETFRDGWAWSVPVSSEARYFTCMIDPRYTPVVGSAKRGVGVPASGVQGAGASGLSNPARLEWIYRASLAKATNFSALLSGAMLETRPWSCDASLYSAQRYIDQRALLAGDAASFIDPLSSFGVKKAMASAWRAAVAVNTCLRRPELASVALEFFSARERHVYEHYLRGSAPYFVEAAARYQHPFWTDRAAVALGASESASSQGLDEDDFRHDPEVLKAFAELRAGRAIRLRSRAGVRMTRAPEIVGCEIVLEDALTTDAVPSGIRFLGGVNLPRLLQIAKEHEQVPDLFEAYNRISPAVTLPNFLGALSVMIAKGILENQAEP